MSPPSSTSTESKWPHRISVLLACVVFPVIWVGGLVTTADAGMAVPDWPNTYNYNMFAYPIRDWFWGPWDLFVEHGHRLLASASGCVAIVLCVVTWIFDRRKSARWWSALVLALIVSQGVLGGQRVLQDKRVLALIHGCLGPLCFATIAAMVALTSRWWIERQGRALDLRRWSTRTEFVSAISLLLISYFQLVVGACLRHIHESADPNVYSMLVIAHVMTALVVVLAVVANAYFAETVNWHDAGIRRVSRLLIGFVILQIGLGITTYIVKFGWPAWMGEYGFAARFIIPEKTFWQATLITMHVALGSLILAFAAYHLACVARAVHNSAQPTSEFAASTLDRRGQSKVQSINAGTMGLET